MGSHTERRKETQGPTLNEPRGYLKLPRNSCPTQNVFSSIFVDCFLKFYYLCFDVFCFVGLLFVLIFFFVEFFLMWLYFLVFVFVVFFF